MKSLSKRDRYNPSTNSMIEDFFNKDLFDWNDKNFSAFGTTLPSANVTETDKKFEIDLAAPGMKKDDFKIELKNSVLSISSEKEEKREEKDAKGNFTRKEFSYQSFFRSFSLPENADDNKIAASYKDGILHIDVSKKPGEAPKTSKTITVK
jgi:HSP20 family protein